MGNAYLVQPSTVLSTKIRQGVLMLGPAVVSFPADGDVDVNINISRETSANSDARTRLTIVANSVLLYWITVRWWSADAFARSFESRLLGDLEIYTHKSSSFR